MQLSSCKSTYFGCFSALIAKNIEFQHVTASKSKCLNAPQWCRIRKNDPEIQTIYNEIYEWIIEVQRMKHMTKVPLAHLFEIICG